MLCHRDYHSRNLHVARGRLFIIDFQDARMGPIPTIWSRCCATHMSTCRTGRGRAHRLLPRAEGPCTTDAHAFRARFDLMAVQRNLKALGTFGYQTMARAKPGLHSVHAAHACIRADESREVSSLFTAPRRAGRTPRGIAILEATLVAV